MLANSGKLHGNRNQMILYNHSLHLFNFGKKDRGGYSNNKKVDMRHLERVFFLLSKKKKKKRATQIHLLKVLQQGPELKKASKGPQVQNVRRHSFSESSKFKVSAPERVFLLKCCTLGT